MNRYYSTNRKVSLSARFAFGVGDLAFNLIWQGTALFLLYFYTDVLGIAPALAGAIYLTAMVWDAITDPIVATLADRTNTKHGKYRPWIFFGALPLAISYPLAFSSSPASDTIAPAVWALATHLLLRTTYTIVGVPFSSLQARLTDGADERTVLAGFRMFGAASGGLAVVFVTPILVGAFGPDREAEAYFSAAAIAGGVAFAALLYCVFSMREPVTQTASTENNGSILADLKSIPAMFVSNPPLMRVFGIIIAASICLAMFSKNILYFFKYNLERPDLTLWALITPALCLFLMVPFWIQVAKRTSKQAALVTGSIIALLGYTLFFFVPEQPIFILSSIIVLGIGGSALPVIFWSMLPDTVEYGELATGIRSEAKTFGFATFAQKAAVGVNALLLGLLLGWVGFEANTDQSDQTLFAIKAIMSGVPAIGIVIVLLLLWGYEIDRETHENTLRQLQIRKGKPEQPP